MMSSFIYHHNNIHSQVTRSDEQLVDGKNYHDDVFQKSWLFFWCALMKNLFYEFLRLSVRYCTT